MNKNIMSSVEIFYATIKLKSNASKQEIELW